MQTVPINEASLRLSDLMEAAASGEEVFIIKDGGLSVQLVPHVAPVRKRQFGSAQGMFLLASDFDAPLEDMSEYER